MSQDAIFLIHDDGTLVDMLAEPYASEDELQRLLAQHSAVLPGAQIDPGAPRRWMLIDREVGVPATESGGNQWSLDHLFVDQDAVPTIVEVKRASDSRIRREVVGQMLDYAANGVRYWPVAELQDRWRDSSGGSDAAEEALVALVGPDVSPEEFWQRVEANLRAGRVRMLFVADRIPPELQRIVEFLNEQMRPAEVLAVELKHYKGDGARTIVPRVIGATALAKQSKKTDDGRTFHDVLQSGPPEWHEAHRLLLEWAGRHQLALATTARAQQLKDASGKTVVQMYADPGWIEVQLGVLSDAGRPDVADVIGTALDQLAGRTLSRRAPGLPADKTVPNWDAFVSEVLDPYLAARRELSVQT